MIRVLEPGKEIDPEFIASLVGIDRQHYGKYGADGEFFRKKLSSCVPLSVDHPYPEAYPFFEGNGYRMAGKLNWQAGANELIACNLLVKTVA